MAISDGTIDALYDSLFTQKASGVDEAFHNGKRVKYRSVEEIDAIMAGLEDAKLSNSGKSAAIKLYYQRAR